MSDQGSREAPTVQRLDSGYWYVRWSPEIWAQWPISREPQESDFFQSTATPERLRACRAAMEIE